MATLEAILRSGEKDAEKKRSPYDVLNSYFRKGIGDIRTAPLHHQTVSWLWFTPPEWVAYLFGFQGKKQYQSDDEKKGNLEALRWGQQDAQQHLYFNGVLNIYPSFGHGRVVRQADADDLKGVRVVLKVGDRIYQPEKQPGDLAYMEGVGSATFATQSTSTSYSNGSANGSVRGPGGISYFNVQGTSTTTNYYTTVHAENYNYYSGQFKVIFDSTDSSGAPIIHPSDKEFTVIVIYGTNERRATYKLEDILRFRKDHAVARSE